MKIAKAFKKYSLRKKAKIGLFLVTIYWSFAKSPKSSLSLAGEFTLNKWKEVKRMKYDLKFKAHRVNVYLKEGDQFKFIENGNYVASLEYDLIYDKSGFQNNIFLLNHKNIQKKNYSIKRLDSKDNLNNSNNILNDHFDKTLSKKNLEILNSNYLDSTKYPVLDEILKKKNTSIDAIIDEGPIKDQDSSTTQLDEIITNPTECILSNLWNVKDVRKISLALPNSPSQNCTKEKQNIDIEEQKLRPLFLVSGVASLGKDNETCEDAFFISENSIGISDGVGGWSNYGFTTDLFSKSLMNNSLNIINASKSNTINLKIRSDTVDSFFSENDETLISSTILANYRKNSTDKSLSPEQVLKEAFERTKAPGSATAFICILKDNQLKCTCLGDSKLMILKMNGNNPIKLFMSKEQQHDFNTPFQFANIPNMVNIEKFLTSKSKEEKELISEKLSKTKFCCDSPEDAESYQIIVNQHDLLILGTDGLFDNLFDYEIIEIVKAFFIKEENITPKCLNDLALEIALKAKERSTDKEGSSPFKDNVLKEFNIPWAGGKVDDITVIVSRVE